MKEALVPMFKVLVQIAIPLAAFATGLRVRDPAWLWRRPRLLARSLVAVLLLVPLSAVLLIELIDPGRLAKAGLVVAILSVGIAPIAEMKRAQANQALIEYEVSFDIVLMSLAVVYVPAAVALHGSVFHHPIRLDPGGLAVVALTRMLIPLALGVVFAHSWPHLTERVGKHAARFVMGVLILVVLVALVASFRSLFSLGARAWLACLAVAASAIAIGHALGRSAREVRPALAAFAALRFPGFALVILAAIPRGHELIPVVLAYVLTSTFLLALYDRFASRKPEQRPGRGSRAHARI